MENFFGRRLAMMFAVAVAAVFVGIPAGVSGDSAANQNPQTSQGAGGTRAFSARGEPGPAAAVEDPIQRPFGHPPNEKPPDRRRPEPTQGKIWRYFEANHGQTDPRVRFLSRGSKHVWFFGDNNVTVSRLDGAHSTQHITLAPTYTSPSSDRRATAQATSIWRAKRDLPRCPRPLFLATSAGCE